MSPEDFAFVTELAEREAGLLVRDDRAFHVESRLGALARREGAASVAALVQRLRTGRDPELRRAAAEALAASDTAFFRDREVFERLTTEVLPALAVRRRGEPVRVWSAGCSTGQEAYSLVMAADGSAVPVQLDLLASDFSERALEKGRSGLYTQFEVQRGLPIRRLISNFERIDDMWRVSPRLRQAVRWRRVNLVGDLEGLGPFDLIVCRNVLSGLAASARWSALRSVASRLSSGGLLVLGAGETAEGVRGLEAEAPGIFRKASPQPEVAAAG